jgi:hypothetical protein
MAEHLTSDDDDAQQPKAVTDEELKDVSGGVYVPGAYSPPIELE